jgi:hypothetical protein
VARRPLPHPESSRRKARKAQTFRARMTSASVLTWSSSDVPVLVVRTDCYAPVNGRVGQYRESRTDTIAACMTGAPVTSRQSSRAVLVADRSFLDSPSHGFRLLSE